MPLKKFKEIMDSITKDNSNEDKKPSLLLGNGFSQAFDSDIFNYQNLFIKADFGDNNDKIKNIFTNFDTYDFEKIMKNIESTKTICSIYKVDSKKIKQFESDIENIKNSLIKVISETHPTSSRCINDEQYKKAKSFIVQFNKIFTLNYDLLLYWIINKYEIPPTGYYKNDGFNSDIWENAEMQDVFFLHGALHLYDTGSDIKKHKFNCRKNSVIIDYVQNNLKKGKFPLFVSEHSPEKKLIQIKHNTYLTHCFESLKELDGTLFIHGHSMDTKDKHIFDQIKKSNIDQIFISIFGDKNSEQNKNTIADAHKFLETNKIKIEFYDAATAPIWN